MAVVVQREEEGGADMVYRGGNYKKVGGRCGAETGSLVGREEGRIGNMVGYFISSASLYIDTLASLLLRGDR